jgi:hypothetical protein
MLKYIGTAKTNLSVSFLKKQDSQQLGICI